MNEPIDILLVEDSPNDVELTLRAFTRQHLATRIQVARDGQEALDFIFGRGAYIGRDLSQQPKLILLDLKLPKVDGLDVLRELKSNPLTQMIPVVVLTSSCVEHDIEEGYQRGANSYLIKPVSYDQFMLLVNALGTYWLRFNQNAVTTPTGELHLAK
jgi:two-component system response regulator